MTHTEFFEQPHMAAALGAKRNGRNIEQPELGELAQYLLDMQTKRGKPMSADHMKQEAAKFVKARQPREQDGAKINDSNAAG